MIFNRFSFFLLIDFLPEFCCEGKSIARDELELVMTQVQPNKVCQTSQCKLLYPGDAAVGQGHLLQVHQVHRQEHVVAQDRELVPREVKDLCS